MSTTISIHQPNYLPYLGYFDKILKSDIFVVFDDVQFPRGKNDNFGHRNQIKTNMGLPKWLTVSLLGKSDLKKFNEIEINYITSTWNTDHLNLMKAYYENGRRGREAQCFDQYFCVLQTLIGTNRYKSLSEMNVVLIKYFLKCLDINTKIMLSSEICPSDISGGEKIMYILKKLNATKYITGSGTGSMRYINEQEYKDNNIELIWQHYNHPTYSQLHGAFIPNMSIVDLLFNEGEKSKEIIRRQ